MIDKATYTIKIEFGVLKVSKRSLTVMKWVIKNGLYTLVGKSVIGKTSPIQDQNLYKVKLWHLRLGHIGQKGLDELRKQGLLGKDNLEKLPFCKDCVFGIFTKVSFKNATHKIKQTLNYIHSNLWGPLGYNLIVVLYVYNR